MKIYRATNELSPIHGDLPTDPAPIQGITINRGYIVYLQLLGGGAFLNGRAFWTSYNQQQDPDYVDCPKDQAEFVSQILALADQDNLLTIKEDKLKPFQDVDKKRFCFSTDVSKIDFGWQPCNVTYIFNNAGIKFEKEDPSNRLIHPVVFRKTKAVNGLKETYRENDSFYEISVDNDTYKNASLIHMKNVMTMKQDENSENIQIAEIDKTTKYDYCLDIPIKISQAPFMAGILTLFNKELLGANNVGSPAALAADDDIVKAIAFVFDPPQGNGGGNGPPDYP